MHVFVVGERGAASDQGMIAQRMKGEAREGVRSWARQWACRGVGKRRRSTKYYSSIQGKNAMLRPTAWEMPW